MLTERPSSFLKLAQKDTLMSVLRWCAVKRGTRLSPCSHRVAPFAALISRFRCAKSASTTAASRRYGCSYLAISCPPCLPLTAAVTHTLSRGDDNGTAPTAVIGLFSGVWWFCRRAAQCCFLPCLRERKGLTL